MNEIKVITELCAEDRARLDRLAEALEKNTHNCADCVQAAVKMTQATHKLVIPVLKPGDPDYTPHEEPKNEPQEPTKVEAPATTPTEEEKPAEVKEAPAEEPKNEPAVTLEQIQQKVVQLCAGFEGKKKPAVREIINTYGAKVSDLKDQPDKWNEVWEKLTALEVEA
jgi:hypothetical protein